MSKTEAHSKTPPPPLNEYGNPIAGDDASIADTSTNPTVEELMKKLDKLNVELTKLKAKDKKGKKHASASEDDDSSYEEEVSNKAKRDKKKNDKSSYNAMSFNYNNMPSSTAYTFIPIGKAPFFDGTNYNQYKHCIKSYLYSFSPDVWQVVCDCVDFPEDDEEQTLKQLQRSIAMHNPSPSSTLRWIRKSSTEWMAWKKLKICGPLSEWPIKDQSP
jgi:hypothetical protein